MKFDLNQVQAALEEFQADMAEAVTAPTEQEEISSDEIGTELGTQSELIDNDSIQLGERVEQIGGVMERIEDAPGEMDAPVDPNVQAGAAIALEALGIALEAEDGETKEGLLAKLRRWIAQAIEMARNFGRRVLGYVKAVYAYATDRAYRNKTRAQRALKRLEDKDFNLKSKKVTEKWDVNLDPRGRMGKEGKGFGDFGVKRTQRTIQATFEDYVSKNARKILLNAQGVSVKTALDNLVKFLNESARASTKNDATQIAAAMHAIASDMGSADQHAEKVLSALDRMTSVGHSASSKSEHRKAVQAGEEVTVYTSPAFFGGYRSWVKMPKTVNGLQYWGHGVSKVDAVAERDRFELPSVDELRSFAKGCVEMSDAIEAHKKHLAGFSEVEDKLKKSVNNSSGKVDDNVKSTAHVRSIVGAIQSIVPRAIKGTTSDVLRYAAEQGGALMSYVDACMNAYTEQDGATNPGSIADSVRNATTYGLK